MKRRGPTSSTGGVVGKCLLFLAQARASSKVLSLALAVGVALVTAETASARPKKHRAERPVAPRVDRSLLPVTLDESGTPKRPGRSEDRPKERAERPRTIARGSSTYLLPVLSPSRPPLPLQPALPVHKPPPIKSVGDRVSNCLHSSPLNAGLGSNPTNRDFYVRSCASNCRMNQLQRAN